MAHQGSKRRGSERRGSERRGSERRQERSARRRVAAARKDRLPFERANWMIFGAALAVIVVGYVALAMGSITLAPILLVLGYCVLIPLAIMVRPRRPAEEPGTRSGE